MGSFSFCVLSYSILATYRDCIRNEADNNPYRRLGSQIKKFYISYFNIHSVPSRPSVPHQDSKCKATDRFDTGLLEA